MAYVFEDKAACCGCGLCKAACPHQAITMTPDEEGFCYPVIDAQRCTNCGACPTCLRLRAGTEGEAAGLLCCAPSRCGRIGAQLFRRRFSAIASFVLEQGGVVFGAVFNENWFVIHTHAETWEELRPMHGSKYIPSNIEAVYPQVETLLRQGRTVLFTGTPCQVAAVRKWMDMRRVPQEKLYLMDIVCHAVASPAIWKEYLQALCKRYGQKPMMLSFRSKKLGWSKRLVSVQLADGRDVTAEWAKRLDF
ncbi:MAG: Coenzyme F420 hydrogenase/dehydrogenase, beta subunit C-terminal domain [Christensenellales bacterium]